MDAVVEKGTLEIVSLRDNRNAHNATKSRTKRGDKIHGCLFSQ